MLLKSLQIVFLLILHQIALSQINTKTGFSKYNQSIRFVLPGESEMEYYYDSLSKVYSPNLLTGYTFSVFNEVIPGQTILYSFNGESFKEVLCDLKGRFFLLLQKHEISTLRLKSNDMEYHLIDTSLVINDIKNEPLILWFQPRYKIVLRGRVILGTLPLEGVEVEIIHNIDTMRTSTQSCFTDIEDYWNCLYNGMFIQEILFDNPKDSIKVNLRKDELIEISLVFTCADYDGTVIPIRMNYKKNLQRLYKHNFLLKVGIPINNNWMIAINYKHQLKSGIFKRLGLGTEIGMIMTKVEKKIPTFPNISSGTDSLFIKTSSEINYVSGYISPDIILWLTHPQSRRFAAYLGLYFPYILNQNRFYFHPYMGARMYLDMNKAIFGECRYLKYDIDEVNYIFNPYGKAYRYTIKESYSMLSIYMGLIISF